MLTIWPISDQCRLARKGKISLCFLAQYKSQISPSLHMMCHIFERASVLGSFPPPRNWACRPKMTDFAAKMSPTRWRHSQLREWGQHFSNNGDGGHCWRPRWHQCSITLDVGSAIFWTMTKQHPWLSQFADWLSSHLVQDVPQWYQCYIALWEGRNSNCFLWFFGAQATILLFAFQYVTPIILKKQDRVTDFNFPCNNSAPLIAVLIMLHNNHVKLY